MKTGIDLIKKERARQISEEGFTFEDDDRYISGELNDAALAYAKTAAIQNRGEESMIFLIGLPGAGKVPWPWEESWWNPSLDPIRNLVKAGALIAAEIDRLQRIQEKK